MSQEGYASHEGVTMDQEILRIYDVEGNGNSSPEYLYNTAHARAQQARNELETYRLTLNT